MKRWMQIKGHKYLIRGDYSPKEVRELFKKFREKYPDSTLSLAQWAAERGKIYFMIPDQDE